MNEREQRDLRQNAMMSLDRAMRDLVVAKARLEVAYTAVAHAHHCLVMIDFPDQQLDQVQACAAAPLPGAEDGGLPLGPHPEWWTSRKEGTGHAQPPS